MGSDKQVDGVQPTGVNQWRLLGCQKIDRLVHGNLMSKHIILEVN
jgi:hypothetical protein